MVPGIRDLRGWVLAGVEVAVGVFEGKGKGLGGWVRRGIRFM